MNYISQAKQYAAYHGLDGARACVITGISQNPVNHDGRDYPAGTKVTLVTRPGNTRWTPVTAVDYEAAAGVFGNITGARHVYAEMARIYKGCDTHIVDVKIERLAGTDHEITSSRLGVAA